MWPILKRHSEILPLANLLTTAMFAYMVCHELAHHNLNHHNIEQSHQLGFDADKLGYNYFCKIIGRFGALSKLKVPPNMHGTPLIGLFYIKALELTYGLPHENTHPSADERVHQLKELFFNECSNESKELFNGLEATYIELIEIVFNLY